MKLYELVKELTITKSHAHFDSIRNTRKIICHFTVIEGSQGESQIRHQHCWWLLSLFSLQFIKPWIRNPFILAFQSWKYNFTRPSCGKDIYFHFRDEASESWVAGDLHKFKVKGIWLTVNDNITIPIIILVNRNTMFPFWAIAWRFLLFFLSCFYLVSLLFS